jgi:hypothetical protein
MLSEFQQNDLWERWLAAEMRAYYFADRRAYYASRQRFLTWITLLFSSGAATTILVALPQPFLWVRAVLAILAAAISLMSLVEANAQRSTDCADLHFRWARLANECQSLWGNVYAEDAEAKLAKIVEKGEEISKSSTAIPYKERVMLKWENHVLQHHGLGQLKTA